MFRWLSLALLPLFVGDTGDGNKSVAGAHVVSQSVHASDGVQLISFDVRAGGINELVFYIDSDDAAEDDARMADFHGSELAAFTRSMCFCESRRLHELRWSGGEAGALGLVHLGWKIGGADVHFFRDVFCDNVDDEFPGAANIAGSVFWDEVYAGPVGDADADDGRVSAEIVVGAEGRGVELPYFIEAGDECDRARGDQTDEQLVYVAGWGGFDVKVHRYSTLSVIA